MNNYCLGCMQPIEKGTEVCPHCGYVQNTPPREVYHFAPGTILHARYYVGRVLGFGGFGVTYIGRDLVLDSVVAIKEYLPSEFATRVQGQQTLSVYTGEAAMQFDAGLKSFSDEAKRLAKFKDVPGVVEIVDTFSENKTAYIVMEYLEGETVKQRLEREGRIPYDDAEEIITAVLATLSAVHRSGIIHRDLSPANIFLTSDGKVKLLDFGAARYASAYHTKSLSVILKPGYAPEEQYRSRGNQGPWTDVYSTAATMYRMITGKTPQESIERMSRDELKEPSKLGVKIDPNKENALMNALNVDISVRTQSAGQFLENLVGGADVERIKGENHNVDEGRWPWWLKALAACVPLAVAGVVLLLSLNRGETVKNDDFTTVPNVLTMDEVSARSMLEESELYMQVGGTVEVDFGDSGVVQELSPASGTYIRKYETVDVGLAVNETVFMPYVEYRDIDSATALIEQAGLNAKIEYVDTTDYAEDTVFWQEYPEGEGLNKNQLVGIKAAVGSPAEDTGETVDIPDVTGMTVEQALAALREAGLYGVITAEEYGAEEFGTVLGSELEAKSLNKNAVVPLRVSLGHEYVRMPSLSLKSKSEAEAILEGLGLVVKYEYKQTNDYAEDLVLEQSVPVGTKLAEGDEVTLTLSRPDYGNVPDVTGRTQAEAAALIEQAGFTARISEEVIYSDTVEKGLVVRQSAVGQLAKGRVVTLSVSAGKTTKTAAVPSVADLSVSEAEFRITAAGFGFAHGGEEYSDTVAKGNVIRCTPTGSQRLGTTVSVTLSKGPNPKPIPNVAGQGQAAAQGALSAMGLSVSVTSQHSESVPYGAVISQSPSPGTLVEQGAPVQLVVSCGTAGKTVSAAEIGNYPASQYTQTPAVEYRYTVTTYERETHDAWTHQPPNLSGWQLVGQSEASWTPWVEYTGTPPEANVDLEIEVYETEDYYFQHWYREVNGQTEYYNHEVEGAVYEKNTGFKAGQGFVFTEVPPGVSYDGVHVNASSQQGYREFGSESIWFKVMTGTTTTMYRIRYCYTSFYFERTASTTTSEWTSNKDGFPTSTDWVSVGGYPYYPKERKTVSVEERPAGYYVTGIPF